jgi:APA family basic amino acid/polyamine antiporter
VYRRRHGLDLFGTSRVVTPAPATEHDIEYESILLVYDHAEFSTHVMRIAVKLAARTRRSIHVLVFIEVPVALPIDASMPEQEQAAQGIIEAAKIKGKRRVHGHWEKVRAGQAGRRIIDEARARGASAIIMPTPPVRRGAVVFGPTIEAVLKERPCRVIIESIPESHLPAAA